MKTLPDDGVRRERRYVIAFALVIFAVTLAAYQPAWHGGVLWDDEAHMTNAKLRSAEGLGRIWFELGATQQYYPLLHSAFWFQHLLWGDETLGYHLVNIVLHVLSAVLFVLILRRLKIPGAFLAGAIFALHPVHVESVAWITELKNTLSGAFYLAGALAYLHFDQNRRKDIYFLALGLFVLALLSKTVTATLPAALLVVFWWQRGRLNWHRDVWPLLPFFVLGVIGGLFTAWVERTYIGAQGMEFDYTFVERSLIAGRVIWFYLGKLLWPADLIFTYPRWEISQAVWWQYCYPLGLIGLLVFLWIVRKRTRAPLAAMLLYCGTLFPVLGFFNIFPFIYSFVADHFQYLASLGIIATVSAGVALLLERWRLWPGPAALAVSLVLVVVLALRTWQQSQDYANEMTLYTATLTRNPYSWMAHNNLGKALEALGRHQEAIARYREALQIRPRYAKAHNNWGASLQALGRHQEAIAHYHEALKIRPQYAMAYNGLGAALQAQGRHQEAIARYQEALRIKPRYASAHNNWGASLQALGRHQEAIARYQEALRIKPDAEVHYNWGAALQAQGRYQEATARYQEALRIKPGHARAHNNWGNALHVLGRREEAMLHYQEAVRIKPGNASTHYNWGYALQALGRHQEAIIRYQEALRIKPRYAKAHNNLGAALQAQGRHEEAIAHYQEALRIEPRYAKAHNNLGAALQAQGRHEEAIAHYQEALRIEPRYAKAHSGLGALLQALGRHQEAIVHYREAVQITPRSATAHKNLAWLLATCPDDSVRDAAQALGHAKRAVELAGNGNPSMLDTLSAAFAETGNFQRAVEWQEKAVQMASDEMKQGLAARLELYKRGQPYRESN